MQPFLFVKIVLNGDGYLVATCNGYFSSLSREVDAWMMFGFTYGVHLNITWIGAQFMYRVLILCGNELYG